MRYGFWICNSRGWEWYDHFESQIHAYAARDAAMLGGWPVSCVKQINPKEPATWQSRIIS